MTESQAKKQLSTLLETYTTGSVLHLLADLYGQEAEEARKEDDAGKFERSKQLEHALFVMGLGIDAANPS